MAADACEPSKNSRDGVTGVGVDVADLRAPTVGETADERTGCAWGRGDTAGAGAFSVGG